MLKTVPFQTIQFSMSAQFNCQKHFYFKLFSLFKLFYHHFGILLCFLGFNGILFAQSAGTVEYTNCFSAQGEDSTNECPVYDTKQSDGEVPAILELWGMRSYPSLPSLPGPLWPGVVSPDKGPIYGLNRTKPCFFHYTDFCI